MFTLIAQRADPGAALAGLLCALVIIVPIGVLIGAVILRAATKWVCKIDLAFGRACGIVLLAGFINFLINLALSLVFPGTPATENHRATQSPVAAILSLVAGFVVATLVYGNMIKDEYQRVPIGAAKGALVTLVSWALVFAIVLVLVLVVVGVMIATGMSTKMF